MRILTLLLAAALPATALFAAEPSFTPAAFKANVEFLADDLLEGRDAGTRGFDIAARYVATRFEALGLANAPGAPNWYQTVMLAEARVAPGTTFSVNGKSYTNGAAIVMGSSLTEPQQSIRAGAVFVGFGLEEPARGLDDYAGLDVRGKFVVVLSGFPKGMPSDVGAHLNSEKARIAQRHGAIGLITVSTRESLSRRPWKTIQGLATRPTLSWVDEHDVPYQAAPGIRATVSVDGEVADALFAGSGRTIATILDEPDRAGARPRGIPLKPMIGIERSSQSRRLKSENVVAVLPGSDPALADEYVLLMAHLDHNGIDPSLKGDAIYNGAMDNASGVSTLLEVARAMASSPDRPRRPVVFAAVTGEEDGLLGAGFLAKHPVIGKGRVVGVVNLDMPVLLYDFTDVVAFGAEHSTLGPIVARATARAGVALSPDPLPAEGLFTRSDHYRFVQEGVPAVFLMTGFAGEGREKFEQFLATHYHKVSDQPDLPFNWAAGAKFARINYLIAREIADADQAPLWYRDSFFGSVFAPAAAPRAMRPR
jgi:hypothetical protein